MKTEKGRKGQWEERKGGVEEREEGEERISKAITKIKCVMSREKQKHEVRRKRRKTKQLGVFITCCK